MEKSELNEMKPPQRLNEEDTLMLKALILSPAFGLLSRIAESEIIAQYRQLEAEKEMHKIFNIQGRINGLRYMQNAPVLFVSAYEKSKEKKSEIASYLTDRNKKNE